jgi:hypothetical protein
VYFSCQSSGKKWGWSKFIFGVISLLFWSGTFFICYRVLLYFQSVQGLRQHSGHETSFHAAYDFFRPAALQQYYQLPDKTFHKHSFFTCSMTFSDFTSRLSICEMKPERMLRDSLARESDKAISLILSMSISLPRSSVRTVPAEIA